MASSTAAKLLLKPGGRLWLADPSRASLLGALPDGASVVADPAGADVAIVFVGSAGEVETAVEPRLERLREVPVLWVAYPKGGRADVNRDSLWPRLAPYGLRPITQVAIDDTWSALRFRPLRPDEPPFTGGR
jgi:hypothetical protein